LTPVKIKGGVGEIFLPIVEALPTTRTSEIHLMAIHCASAVHGGDGLIKKKEIHGSDGLIMTLAHKLYLCGTCSYKSWPRHTRMEV